MCHVFLVCVRAISWTRQKDTLPGEWLQGEQRAKLSSLLPLARLSVKDPEMTSSYRCVEELQLFPPSLGVLLGTPTGATLGCGHWCWSAPYSAHAHTHANTRTHMHTVACYACAEQVDLSRSWRDNKGQPTLNNAHTHALARTHKYTLTHACTHAGTDRKTRARAHAYKCTKTQTWLQVH